MVTESYLEKNFYILKSEIPVEDFLNVKQQFINNLEKKDIPQLINKERKDTWERALEILTEIKYPYNKKAVDSLLWLLQDYNWPGVLQGIKILKNIYIKDPDCIKNEIRKTLKISYEKKDTIWIAGIKYLIQDIGINMCEFDENILNLAEW